MSIARLAPVLLTACTSSTLAPPVPAIAPAAPALRDARFVDEIAKAATSYQPWGRVDEAPNIAPALCRMPTREDYGMASHVRQSQAPDGPHGNKLYYLWASQRAAYRRLPALPIVDGFTIVKESFAATTHAPADAPRAVVGYDRTPTPVRWVETDHGTLYAGAPVGLYLMIKVGEREGTDDGWIYGTVAPSGEVTSAGRVASCMGCHEAAPHGRLFGLAPTKQLVDFAPKDAPNE